VIPVCAKIESEFVDLTEEEAQEFLAELGAKESGLESLIHKAFELLGLQSYFTAGVQEVRAWTIKKVRRRHKRRVKFIRILNVDLLRRM
jgi:ribosome-binding ATPase YchF (GTP1/OBG family)